MMKKVEGENKEKKRNKSGVPLGRPPEKNKIEIAEDPTSIIQEEILKYLSDIGLKHGLVFRAEERVKLNKQAEQMKITKPKPIWKDDHSWDKQTELKKIRNNKNFMQVIREVESKLKKMNKPLTVDNIVKTLLAIGDLTVDECT